MLIDEEEKKILREYQLPGIRELPSVVMPSKNNESSQDDSFITNDEISGDFDMEDNE